MMSNVIQKLRTDIAAKTVFTDFNTRLEGMLVKAGRQRVKKSIKDHTWGLINISAEFAPLVDSRLFQRLRRVRQLELASLVYPSANHSRFEHAIGCLHAMDTLIKSVGNNGRNDSRRVIPNSEQKSRLLWSALLHDVGHMPFSHTFERVLRKNASKVVLVGHPFEEIDVIFGNHLEKDLNYYQIIAILIILSPAFRRYVDYSGMTTDSESDLFWNDVASYIAEIPTSSEERGCVQMLSGACDADKLDYMFRDAKATGVPISVDLSRLLDRCFLYRVEEGDLLPKSRKIDRGTLFLTDQSGANTLEEMAISRFVLYDRVYNHQKARAAEAVLEDLLIQGLSIGIFSYDLFDNLLKGDDEILIMGREHPQTSELATALLFRELPNRAVIYAQRLVNEPHFPWDNGEGPKLREELRRVTYNLLEQLDSELQDPGKRSALLKQIRSRAEGLAAHLELNLPPLKILTAFARPATFFGPSSDALILSADGVIEEFRNHMPIEQWGVMTALNKKLGYFFCDPEWRQMVYIAAEIEIWKRFFLNVPMKNLGEEDTAALQPSINVHIHLASTSAARAKLDVAELESNKCKLDAFGVYKETPALRPIRRGGFDFRLLAKRFDAFQGVEGWGITEEHLMRYFRQFPVVLQDELDRQLRSMRILSRKNFIPNVVNRIKSIIKDNHIDKALAFGLSPNSGSLVSMLADAEGRASLGDKVHFVREPFGQKELDGNAVIFLDDLICSGSQASTQVQAWSGVPQADWMDPKEKNINFSPLSDVILESFSKAQVHFVFGSGHEDGVVALEKTSSDLNVSAKVHVIETFTNEGEIDDDLHKYLKEVGESILLSSRPPDYPDRLASCRRDALGYGERCAWVMNMFNAPTICPPALWCPGVFSEAPWMPLFIRRGYQNSVRV